MYLYDTLYRPFVCKSENVFPIIRKQGNYHCVVMQKCVNQISAEQEIGVHGTLFIASYLVSRIFSKFLSCCISAVLIMAVH